MYYTIYKNIDYLSIYEKMAIFTNTSDKKMLEIIGFGDSYPREKFEMRKKIKSYIREKGYGSTFLVEDFHFPRKTKKSNNEQKNNSLKSLYFVECQDSGMWIFTIEGAGKGAHTELQYLIGIINGAKPKFVSRNHFKNLIYGIFIEEGKSKGASDVLIGNIPETKQFRRYKYRSLKELKELIDVFLFIIKRDYNVNNIDRLCARTLPRPMCEIDRNIGENLREDEIAEADYLCKNDKCAKWISKKHAIGNICPKCKDDLLQFDW